MPASFALRPWHVSLACSNVPNWVFQIMKKNGKTVIAYLVALHQFKAHLITGFPAESANTFMPNSCIYLISKPCQKNQGVTRRVGFKTF